MANSARFAVRADASHKCLVFGMEALRKRSSRTMQVQVRGADVMDRRMALADVVEYDERHGYSGLGEMFADVVTGTLYSADTGKCLSSDQLTLMVRA